MTSHEHVMLESVSSTGVHWAEFSWLCGVDNITTVVNGWKINFGWTLPLNQRHYKLLFTFKYIPLTLFVNSLMVLIVFFHCSINGGSTELLAPDIKPSVSWVKCFEPTNSRQHESFWWLVIINGSGSAEQPPSITLQVNPASVANRMAAKHHLILPPFFARN